MWWNLTNKINIKFLSLNIGITKFQVQEVQRNVLKVYEETWLYTGTFLTYDSYFWKYDQLIGVSSHDSN